MSAVISPRSAPTVEVLDGETAFAVRRSPFAGPTETLRAPEGASLAEMSLLAAPDPVLRAHLVAFVDGDETLPETWPDVRPRAGQTVVFAVRPGQWRDSNGNNDSGKVIRAILSIAIIALASYVSQGAWTPAALEWAAPFLGAGVAIAGNLAINALVPLDKPQFERSGTDPFYSIAGARNTALPWQPVPIVLGKHRWTPPLWGRYIQETVGDEVWLRMAFALGPAPVAVSDIRIGETPIGDFEGVEMVQRLTADAPQHRLYTGDPDQTGVGAKLTTDWQTRTTGTDVDEIEVILGFREGLGALDDEGKKVTRGVGVEVQWRYAGDASATWSDLRPLADQANAAALAALIADLGSPPVGASQMMLNIWHQNYRAKLDELKDALNVTNGAYPFTRADPGRAFQRVIRWVVPRGQFQVRVRRVLAESTDAATRDAVWWEAIGSTRSWVDPFPERRMASIELRIRASEQLSGVVDTFNLVQESIVPVFTTGAKENPYGATAASLATTAASRNPAELALWSCRGPHAAIPKPDSEIDWPAWAAFAAWCEDAGLHYDEPLTRAMTRGETLRRICAAGHGAPVRVNGKLSVVVDRPRTGEAPSQVFTPRNVSGFRMTKTFPPEVHAVRIGFANANNGWQPDEVVLYADGYAAEDVYDGPTLVKRAATRYETLEVPGKTDPDEVRTVGRQYFNNALRQTERFTFDLDAESLTATLGAYVLAQHDVMAVGLGSAKVAAVEMSAGNVAAFVLDAPVATEAGPTLAVRWREVATAAGEAWLEASSEIAIARDAGNPRRFTLATPAAAANAPAVGQLVVIGETERVAHECLVRHMEPAGGDRARLTLVAYAPERFTADGTPLPPHDPKTSLPIGARPAAPVLVSVHVTSRDIAVNFVQPASPRGIVLRGYESRVRAHGASADSWTGLPWLPAGSMSVVAPPGDPGATYDIEIVAVGSDAGGLPVRSDPLLVSAIAAEAAPPPPAGVSGAFVIRNSTGGARQVVFTGAWTPNNDPDVLDTRLDIQTAPAVGETPATWAAVGGARASSGAVELAGLAVGRSYVFSFVNVTRRGAESSRVILAPLTAADVLGATEASTAAPGSALAGEIQAIETDIADLFDIAGWPEGAGVSIYEVTQNLFGTDGTATGRYGVIVNANGHVGGFGIIGTTPPGKDPEIVAIFDVDQFAIGNADTDFVPFRVVGDNVYIKNALIQGGSFYGSELAASAQIRVGSGATSMTISGQHPTYRTWAGAEQSEAAPFKVTTGGKVIARDLEIRDAGGVLIFSSSAGFSDAARTQLLLNTATRTSTATGSLADDSGLFTILAASTTTVELTAELPVVGLTWAEGAAPASITARVRHRPVGGSWTDGPLVTFTKITSGSPTATQYRVVTVDEIDMIISGEGGEPTHVYSPAYDIIEDPLSLSLTATAALSGGVTYEFSVVVTGVAVGRSIRVETESGAADLVLPGAGGTGSGGSPGTFLFLSDTPASYAGAANRVAAVNAGATGMVFADVTTLPGVWSESKARLWTAKWYYSSYKTAGNTVDEAINAAIDACHAAGGGDVVVPAGRLLVDGPIVEKSFVHLRGAGMGVTIIAPSATYRGKLLKTVNFDTLYGTDSPGGPKRFGIWDMTFDGDKWNYAEADRTDANTCVNLYGRDYDYQRVEVINCPGRGLISQWGTGAAWDDDPDDWAMEARLVDFSVSFCWKAPFFDGPHDSQIKGYVGALNWHFNDEVAGSANFWFGPRSSGTEAVNFHPWGDQAKIGTLIDGNDVRIHGGVFDDAQEAIVALRGSGNRVYGRVTQYTDKGNFALRLGAAGYPVTGNEVELGTWNVAKGVEALDDAGNYVRLVSIASSTAFTPWVGYRNPGTRFEYHVYGAHGVAAGWEPHAVIDPSYVEHLGHVQMFDDASLTKASADAFAPVLYSNKARLSGGAYANAVAGDYTAVWQSAAWRAGAWQKQTEIGSRIVAPASGAGVGAEVYVATRENDGEFYERTVWRSTGVLQHFDDFVAYRVYANGAAAVLGAKKQDGASNVVVYGSGGSARFGTDDVGDLLRIAYGGGDLSIRHSSGSYGKAWTELNDGTGSGLDADLWQGWARATTLNQALLTTSAPAFIGLTLTPPAYGGIVINGQLATGSPVDVLWRTSAAVRRWALRFGSDTDGNDLEIIKFNTGGTYDSTPWALDWATGRLNLNQTPYVNGAAVWHADNDGHFSGLVAQDSYTLQGNQPSATPAAWKIAQYDASGYFTATRLYEGANRVLTEASAVNAATLSGNALSATPGAWKVVQYDASGNISANAFSQGGAAVWDAATLPVTTFAKTFLDDTTDSAVRATLGLVIGTNVQAYSALLAAFAGQSPAADRLSYWTGSGALALATFTAAGRALVDDVDAAAQRATLGLGTAAIYSVGTSGATVPLLNNANAWAAAQTMVQLNLTPGAYNGIAFTGRSAASNPVSLTWLSSAGQGRFALDFLSDTDGNDLQLIAYSGGAYAGHVFVIDHPTRVFQFTNSPTVGANTIYHAGNIAANASSIRSNLGLGSAALKNTGTSGDAVPLLNTAVAFSQLLTASAGLDLGGRLKHPAATWMIDGNNANRIQFASGSANYFTSPDGYHIFQNASLTTTHSLEPDGDMWIGGTLTQASDERLKSGIRDIEDNVIDAAARFLRGKRFRQDGQQRVGLIAQDVLAILPELVRQGPNGYLALDYSGLIPVILDIARTALDEVRELRARLEAA